MKKLYTLFLLILSLICFDGCAKTTSVNEFIFEPNAFRIVRQALSSGQITLAYIFPVNSTKLVEMGYNEDEIRAYKFYLASYVNTLAQNIMQKEIDGVEVQNCAYYSDVDGIGFSIIFENLDAQKKFFNVTEESNSSGKNQKKSGFFIKKTQIETTFPISTTKIAGDLKLVCTMAISSWCKNNNISTEKEKDILRIFDESVFIYDFACQDQTLKSSVMYQDQNFYHNIFVKTLDEIEKNNRIIFWVTYINRPVWYLSALIIVVIGMGVSFTFLNCKNNSKKKENI